MMGQEDRDEGQLFYEFKLDEVVPNLLRRMKICLIGVLADLHQQPRLIPEHRGLQAADAGRFKDFWRD
jgi:hypothetical protein